MITTFVVHVLSLLSLLFQDGGKMEIGYLVWCDVILLSSITARHTQDAWAFTSTEGTSFLPRYERLCEMNVDGLEHSPPPSWH